MGIFNQTRPVIIGVDSGYGNIKTVHFCFPTAVTAHDREPVFKMNLLVYNGRYYTIGEGHKEFVAEKAVDQDHYVLMLAGVAQELRHRNLTSANVHLAAGLPLTWVGEQKESYRTYLLQNDAVDFNYRGVDYHIEFAGADIFPQGFSAVADKLHEFPGVNMLCDIGNGTTLRFHLDREEDRAALAYLQGVGKTTYGSYSKAVVAAVNDHFARLERLNADPYLETREKEDAFLRRVEEIIQRALQSSSALNLNGLAALLQGTAPPGDEPASASAPEHAEDLDAATDFIAGL